MLLSFLLSSSLKLEAETEVGSSKSSGMMLAHVVSKLTTHLYVHIHQVKNSKASMLSCNRLLLGKNISVFRVWSALCMKIEVVERLLRTKVVLVLFLFLLLLLLLFLVTRSACVEEFYSS
ncbi:unnamed protein product [Polarella glacialis]|uniref:Uncharacterized protein n=1 Tax=Polarella glacialis TaxID=89957 RepID=A0A813FXT1_POLGL|nr:unnamed protein product [Polarella glacialis]CAE8618845.1 unnamed protein product [Polarella glacialis]CAE8651087.1 unnamed protein product [Polarella glacialis]